MTAPRTTARKAAAVKKGPAVKQSTQTKLERFKERVRYEIELNSCMDLEQKQELLSNLDLEPIEQEVRCEISMKIDAEVAVAEPWDWAEEIVTKVGDLLKGQHPNWSVNIHVDDAYTT